MYICTCSGLLMRCGATCPVRTSQSTTLLVSEESINIVVHIYLHYEMSLLFISLSPGNSSLPISIKPFSAKILLHMRISLIFVFFCLYLISDYVCDQPTPDPPHMPLPIPSPTTLKCKIASNYNTFQISILVFGVITLFWLSFIYLCKHVRFVTFNSNLNLRTRRENSKSPSCVWTLLSLTMLGLLLSEYPEDIMLFFITCFDFSIIVGLITLKLNKIISQICFCTVVIFTFSTAVSPIAYNLCLVVF